MLDFDHDAESLDDSAQFPPCEIQLPEEWDDFFEASGLVGGCYDENRRFSRYFSRGRAVIRHRGVEATVYLKDLSREGVGLIHSKQMYPGETCLLQIPNHKEMRIRIMRCRYVQDRCYELGAKFHNQAEEERIPALERYLAAK